jgi:hypothetical protein
MTRRLILALLLVLGLSGVAYADRARDQGEQLDEIVRLVREGVSDEIIIKHIEASGFVFDLSTDDILDLRDLGVNDAVIETMLDTAIQDDGSRRTESRDDSANNSDSSASLSLSAGYFSPWYRYPYAWGFYYDPFPTCFSSYYYPFRYGYPWGYYGYAHHYYYRNWWPRYRFDNPNYYAWARRHQGDGVRVARHALPRRGYPMGIGNSVQRDARRIDRPMPGGRGHEGRSFQAPREVLHQRFRSAEMRRSYDPPAARPVDRPLPPQTPSNNGRYDMSRFRSQPPAMRSGAPAFAPHFPSSPRGGSAPSSSGRGRFHR